MPAHIESFAVPPLGCNCTICGDTDSGDAVVVDPGGNVQEILAKLKEKNLTCKRVLITHGHLDHILGGGELKEATGCDIIMHQDDLGLYENVAAQCRDFGAPPPAKPLPKPDAFVSDNEVIKWAPSYSVRCIHCPGHTPGSTSYLFEEAGLLCPGDTLFKRSVGRTQWAGIPSLEGTSDSQQIIGSIKHKLFTLPDATEVVSGHGSGTTIGDEKRGNMFVR
jgi:hydroxyacylglutathione hydrolase